MSGQIDGPLGKSPAAQLECRELSCGQAHSSVTVYYHYSDWAYPGPSQRALPPLAHEEPTVPCVPYYHQGC